MLDPNEWTLAFAVAIVPKRHRYIEAEPMKLVGEDGRFMRVHARIFNGVRQGMVEETLSVGAIENQSHAVLESLFTAAESIDVTSREPAATIAVDGEALAAAERARQEAVPRERAAVESVHARQERALREYGRDTFSIRNGLTEPTSIEIWKD